MTEGIIKGSGNSRYLRTVANARTLYPDFDAFLSALIQGTFPVDFNGINSSGWSTVGTRLNKASLLTDSLCSALGLPTSATPTQAMDKLRQLINTAQSTADGRPKIEEGSYVGTGDTTNKKVIQLTRKPLFFSIYRDNSGNFSGIWLYHRPASATLSSGAGSLKPVITWGDNSVSLGPENSGYTGNVNEAGATYRYWALIA